MSDADNEDEPGKLIPMRLIGSLANIGRVDDDILIMWAKLASMYCGDCLVIPTINKREGVVEELQRIGVPVFMRDVPKTKMPIGRARPARKYGLDLTESALNQSIDDLVRRFRDEEIVFHCPRMLTQIQTFVKKPDGCRAAQEGYSDSEIIAAGIAATHIRLARAMNINTQYSGR